MKIIRKHVATALAALFLFCGAGAHSAFSESYSAQQLIPAGHWVYDALTMLNNSVRRTSFATNAPLSVAELRMYLELIPYERLSDSAKQLYDEVFSFLTEKKFTFDMGGARFGFNVDLYPLFLAKTNGDIAWTFSNDYTGHKNSVSSFPIVEDITKPYETDYNTKSDGTPKYSFLPQEPAFSEYIASTGFSGTRDGKALVTLPLYLGWSDYFFIQTEPCFAKSIWAMSESGNFTNLTYSSADMDFLWPRNAYGSVGKAFSAWGVNLNVGRQGLQIGKTQTGSIIYNSTFETDGYVQLNLYSPRLKYNLDVVEISKNKYLYLHSIEARPLFNWIRLAVTEGMLIQQPFELRFLNPIMIMHSFGAWEQYTTDAEEDLYGEAHVAAYMGIQVEITPIKNFRMYFLYAQNEIQSEAEMSSANGKALPDSLGAQLGFELTVPDNAHGGWWTGTLEGIYTTPYLYVKQGADWSLYSSRYNMQSHGSSPICSWIGTPFGPDATGFQTRLGYSRLRKWNAELDYLFVAHGTNSFGLFANTVEVDGETYYAYYPSVLYRMGLLSEEQAANIARDYKLTGTVQFTNQITLKGSYRFNEHFVVDGRGTYSFVFNNNNEAGEFAHGLEATLALEYLLF